MASILGIRELPRQIGESEEPRRPFADRHDSVVTFGDFRIDLRSRRASVKGRELPLDEAEFEVLMFLTGHPTNVVTPHTRLSTRGGREMEQPDFLRVLSSLQRKLESVPGGVRRE